VAVSVEFMKTRPAPALPFPRISAAEFAALFSGEDAPEPPASRPRGGLMRATAALLAQSARTLVGPPERPGGAQALARRAM
jgi:hypothetical protein